MWKWIIGGFVALAVIGAVAGGSEEKKTVAQEAGKVTKDVSVEKAEAKPEPPAEPASSRADLGAGERCGVGAELRRHDAVLEGGPDRAAVVRCGRGLREGRCDLSRPTTWTRTGSDEAVESAENYLDTMAFSKESLISAADLLGR